MHEHQLLLYELSVKIALVALAEIWEPYLIYFLLFNSMIKALLHLAMPFLRLDFNPYSLLDTGNPYSSLLSHTLGVRYSLGREHELNTHTKQVAT
jgi:hypothetical protein